MKTKSLNLKCSGVGLIALDLVVNGKPKKFKNCYAGGSCGNVLTILSFLGWDTYPIARLSKDRFANALTDDLEKWDVHINLVEKSSDGSTPIIIHRITQNKKGEPKHRFEFKWPDTGKWLPSYKPVLSKKVEEITTRAPHSNVFYFDRVNRASVELAKYHKENGALIMFEPSSIKEDKLFHECLEVSHILKYSNERLHDYTEIYSKPNVLLEIETLGKNGLRYRLKKSRKKEWKHLEAFKIPSLKDAAGSGDWCSAGLINYMGNNSHEILSEANYPEIEKALNFGQILAATNCAFEGARGLMYGLSQVDLNSFISLFKLYLEYKQITDYPKMMNEVGNFWDKHISFHQHSTI